MDGKVCTTVPTAFLLRPYYVNHVTTTIVSRFCQDKGTFIPRCIRQHYVCSSFVRCLIRPLYVCINESGSFRSYSRSVRSFRPGSFRPDFRGESFRPNWGGSFRSNFKGGSFRPDFRGESFRPDLFILEKTGKVLD